VIVEDCQCLAGVVGGLDIAGGEGAHDVTPGYPDTARSGPVDIPLQAYFRINTENMGQFERTLIIVDEGASADLPVCWFAISLAIGRNLHLYGTVYGM
jgi:hypothetical protein